MVNINNQTSHKTTISMLALRKTRANCAILQHKGVVRSPLGHRATTFKRLYLESDVI